MDGLASLLIYAVDWRWQAIGGLVVVAALGLVVIRLLGLRLGLQVLGLVGAVYAALVYGRRERQQGRADAIAQGERDAQDAVDRAERARRAAHDRLTSRPGRLRDDDGYRRD